MGWDVEVGWRAGYDVEVKVVVTLVVVKVMVEVVEGKSEDKRKRWKDK